MTSGTHVVSAGKFKAWFFASLFLTVFLVSTSASAQAPVANVERNFAGAEAGEWGGQNGAVIGAPDGTCAAMGAVGKVNLVSNFGFTLPGNATITTVTAYVKAGESTQQPVSTQLATNAAVDPPVPIGSVIVYDTMGTGNNCAGTVVTPVGGALALWGNPALTPAIVNSSAFGMIFIKVQQSNVKFDSICLEIGYNTPTGPAVQESCTGVVPPSNTIRVVKTVEGAPPVADWSFNGTAPLGAFTLPAGGGFQDFANLNDGTYTITETTKPGYIVTSECVSNDVVVATGNQQISVDVSGNATFTCVFTNTATTGTVTVIKDFSDDNPAAVNMTLTCTSGTIGPANPLPASEGSPAVFTVTGFTAGATCTATEAATPGYSQNIQDCQRAGISAVNGVCTMVNSLQSGNLTVTKICDPANDPGLFNLEIDGAGSTDSACGDSYGPIAVGVGPHTVSESGGTGTNLETYGVVIGGDCAANGSVNVANGDNLTCTITNTLNNFNFTVNKDFSDDNPGAVAITLTCTSGTITTNPLAATEASPAVFEITGALPDATCTATEEPLPGYTQDISACQAGGLLADGGSCTITNTLNDFTFTVVKDYSDDSTTPVDITLTCSSGNITTNPLPAFEGSDAVFQITGALPDATCTATEAATPGYSQNIDGCQAGGLLADGGTCTIVNTLNAFNFTVNKDFSDDNTDSVDMTLTCSSGTVTTNPVAATEASPAVFEITGALPDATCTATEAATPGYDQNIDGCQAGGLLADGGSCTMVNTLTNGTFTVIKDFSDDNPDPVDITLTCTGGNITTNPLPASEGSPAFFEITGFEFGVTCTATEAATPGYDQDIDDCQQPDLSANGGSCTMTNTLRVGSFTVRKIFSDDNPMDVSVTASCTSGTVTNNPQPASISQSAIFEVTGFEDGATCTATEAVPDGYEADISDCQDGDPVNGGCAITNELIPRTTFRVLKDFTDDNPMDVEVTIDCFTGLPITQTQEINEQQDVVFVVESFEPGELDCEISEVVPTGYTPTYTASLGQDGMSNVAPYSDADGCYFDEVINGEFVCSIVNEPNLVDIEIEKLWIIEGMGGNVVDQNYRLTLFCDAQIEGGQEVCPVNFGLEGGGPIPAYQTCLIINGYGSQTFTPQARPDYPSSHCWVIETVYDDYVEVDNGCLNLQISAAEGGDSCLITNTVFFEGIPTLNQYGMLLLALLMLGVGMVSFRRFA